LFKISLQRGTWTRRSFGWWRATYIWKSMSDGQRCFLVRGLHCLVMLYIGRKEGSSTICSPAYLPGKWWAKGKICGVRWHLAVQDVILFVLIEEGNKAQALRENEWIMDKTNPNLRN